MLKLALLFYAHLVLPPSSGLFFPVQTLKPSSPAATAIHCTHRTLHVQTLLLEVRVLCVRSHVFEKQTEDKGLCFSCCPPWPLRARKRNILLIFSPLLSVCFLGDSCGEQGGVFSCWWQAKTTTSPPKPKDFRLSVKSAVSEQHPTCHGVILKSQYDLKKHLPFLSRSLQNKSGRRHLHDGILL